MLMQIQTRVVGFFATSWPRHLALFHLLHYLWRERGWQCVSRLNSQYTVNVRISRLLKTSYRYITILQVTRKHHAGKLIISVWRSPAWYRISVWRSQFGTVISVWRSLFCTLISVWRSQFGSVISVWRAPVWYSIQCMTGSCLLHKDFISVHSLVG